MKLTNNDPDDHRCSSKTNCLPAFSLSLFLCFPFRLSFLSIFIHFNLIYSISLHFNLIISQLTVQINCQFNWIVCSIELSVETKWQFNSNESNTFIAQPKHQQQHNRKANTNTNVNSSATFFLFFLFAVHWMSGRLTISWLNVYWTLTLSFQINTFTSKPRLTPLQKQDQQQHRDFIEQHIF